MARVSQCLPLIAWHEALCGIPHIELRFLAADPRQPATLRIVRTTPDGLYARMVDGEFLGGERYVRLEPGSIFPEEYRMSSRE
jgi:hypothetical protein